jgi:DNA-binding NarL/FixJ family response regulator
MCLGLDNAAIAEKAGVTLRTTAFHITNLLKKLEVDSRQQAIAWAFQQYGDDLRAE